MNFSIKIFRNSIILLAFFTIALAFTPTNSDKIEIDLKDLTGCWVYKNYKDGMYQYSKSADFKSNKPGYKLNEDGTAVKRTDPNWCARVAGPYTNLDGTYSVKESVLTITYKCPIADKPSLNDYKIVELSSKKLVLKAMPLRK